MSDQFPISNSLDTRGLRCPIPLLRAKQALKAMQVGEYLEVFTTDPSAKGDFDAMLKHLPHCLVSHALVDSELDAQNSQSGTRSVERFVILKGKE